MGFLNGFTERRMADRVDLVFVGDMGCGWAGKVG